MNTDAKEFKIEDVIGSASGILLGDIEGIYHVISFFAGYSVMTHEFIALIPRVREAVLKQKPEYQEAIDFVKGYGIDSVNITEAIKSLHEKYSESVSLFPAQIDTSDTHEVLAKIGSGRDD